MGAGVVGVVGAVGAGAAGLTGADSAFTSGTAGAADAAGAAWTVSFRWGVLAAIGLLSDLSLQANLTARPLLFDSFRAL